MSTSPSKLLPPDACEFRFVHSSGPGGQHVNKASTAVELRVDVSLLGLNNGAEGRLRQRHANRINKEGVLVIQAATHRSQLKNRRDAIARVEALIAEARKRPKTRIATQPTFSAKRRRVEQKKKHASTKRQRQRPDW